MIDKLSLTINIVPNVDYLMNHGEIREDTTRRNIYKYMCQLDRALIFYSPHKFSSAANAKISFTKVEINPKHFESYAEMEAYLFALFSDSGVNASDFKVSRIDIAVDIEDFPIDILLSILRISRIRTESLSFFKGTIYAGSDPKVRIYNKSKELKSKSRKAEAGELTEYEQRIIESGKIYTRFEVQIRSVNKTLQDIVDDPAIFASYFDRLEFFDFKDNAGSGVLQVLMKYVNRKFRSDLEKFRNTDITEKIKSIYKTSVSEWFDSDREPF